MMLIASVMDVVWVGLGAAFTLLLVVGLVFWIRREWLSSAAMITPPNRDDQQDN